MSADITAQYGVAAGRDIRSSTITIGYTAEQVQALIRASTQELKTLYQTQVDGLSGKLDVTRDAVFGFFRILDESQVSLERLPEKLAEIAERHKALDKKLATFTSEDPAVNALKAQAREPLEAGDFERAEQLLKQAKEKDVQAARQMQEAAKERLLSAAASAAELGDLKNTQLAYIEAAAYYHEAAQLVPADEEAILAGYLNQEGRALLGYGDEKGDNAALLQAIGIFQEALSKHTRERAPLAWAMTQTSLGNALQTLGSRESGTARLEEAIAAYRDALQERTRERVPLDWADRKDALSVGAFRPGEMADSSAT